ncbi:MAG: MATE family efflux transporter, partial [Clostridia bacterium]|nr:MATE family efflux transporter [Clostridia bacterium]
RSSDLTTGPLGRQIISFSIPLIFSNLLQVVFNLSDIAVVGRFAGTIPLGAVGSTATLVTLFIGFLIGIGAGVNVVTAHYLGADMKKDVFETVHTAFPLSFVAGLVILLLGQLFSRPLLILIGTKAELLSGAELYLHIYFLGMPAMAIYNCGSAILSASGDTRRPLVYLSTAGVINVLLNLFFVIVVKLDVAGVAIASVVSEYLSALLVARALIKERSLLRLSFANLRITARKAKIILRLGLPSGVQGAIFAVANLFIQAGVNSFDTTMVAGNAAASNTDAIIYNAMAAFYTACASFMGQNYGAHKFDRVKKSFLFSLADSFGIAVLLCALFLLFGRQFLSLFAKDEAVIEAGMYRLIIMCLSYPF